MMFVASSLLACFNYESFQRGQITEGCEWAEKCGLMSETTVAECVDAQDGEIKVNATCDDFDATAASACLDEMDDLGCLDF
jgi:hypothetical protein